MSKNAVCYLCKGCGIGDALDFERLTEVVEEGGVSEVKEHDALCSPEGLAMIKEDIDGGVDAVLIGACSSRVKTDEFSFGGGVVVERTSLREQVVWCTSPDATDDGEEDRQMLAEDYLRMACVKLEKCQPLTPFQLEGEIYKSLMVVGGGPAGMSAAIQAAKAGSQVFLIEKEDKLGGFLNTIDKLGPQSPPYTELEDNPVAEMVGQIEASDKIKVFTGCTVAKTAGAPGKFDVELSNGEKLQIGAIVQATGWLPYDASKLADELAYGSSPDIVTNVEFEQMVKDGKLARKSDGEDIAAIAFIQCAGSRDQNHLPYCSAFCCLVSLKQAIYVKEQNPETAVYVIYKDIRTPSQSEEVYREAQRKGVIFIRRDETYPTITAGDKLSLEVNDVLLGEDVSLEELDMVVLATGMRPNNPKVVDAPLVAFGEDQEVAKKLTAEAKAACEDWSVLNLDYRQGKNLPTLKYAMPDSHFICFPYESRRTGIYPVGTVRRPMRLTQAIDDGVGAALKAIQAIKAAEAGCAVHPRSGDESFPEFFMQRCTQCKRCTEECPFGAINEDEKANPLPNPTRCRRCGVCMGACPERIISFKNYSVDMIGSMIKAINVPEEDDEKPRVIMLACENDALPAIDMAAAKGMTWSPYVRLIPIRCLGSMNLVWIADALSSGIDGVVLLGCRRGEDYQCHFIKGSELANVRMSKISETLTRLVLESDRVAVEEVSITDLHKIPAIIDAFMETIEEVGPNPYKGF
ncbi:methyl-viologen-reducing hydrogenase delta subunit [Desulfarculus baarsii DSM 2075]|uniref:Methyl-viologen-reducing hydrogenase delta subunit n=1 Tax=Desulfarculus baarsii (strain ATCC 33931 / DSM 2075 / LMG 7858 / VKM B-1802 / 2st14) TaxID=644282 RepID=E1QFL8_DESB2|nr:hydrogenase iron-sulfur subunit [Desulfarculus baarsii]ADK84354.1 methyl-viologen-reducing hydrogenase delta subunit [Desulfarculus baarsii DSM 2075]